MTKIIKTPYKVEKERRELAAYNEYLELIQNPLSSKTAAIDMIVKKYNLGTRQTFYMMKRRVIARLYQNS